MEDCDGYMVADSFVALLRRKNVAPIILALFQASNVLHTRQRVLSSAQTTTDSMEAFQLPAPHVSTPPVTGLALTSVLFFAVALEGVTQNRSEKYKTAT